MCAFKEAMIELSNNQANKEMRGKRGYGAWCTGNCGESVY